MKTELINKISNKYFFRDEDIKRCIHALEEFCRFNKSNTDKEDREATEWMRKIADKWISKFADGDMDVVDCIEAAIQEACERQREEDAKIAESIIPKDGFKATVRDVKKQIAYVIRKGGK